LKTGLVLNLTAEGYVRRRDFIKVIAGSPVVWPLAARAQQPAMPVIGFLSFRSANESAGAEAAFREGLSEIGYSEGRNVHIAFRWAEGQTERLPVLAADLVDNLHVAVIASTGGVLSALAAKAATKTIPIVFTHGADPVRAGIVASLNRPEENITGVTWFGGDLAGKRLALLHDIVPNISTIGFLMGPDPDESSQRADVQDVARRFDLKLVVMNATTEREIDAAFATFAQQQVGAVVIASDPFLVSRRERIFSLAAHHGMATTCSSREYVAAGCLMSYGNSTLEAYRHAGLYVGRILRGAKPSELPIERLSKFEFIINLTTAKKLGLTVPASFQSLASELIE
jgi:putative tryptophan/tyrosine transport system substrate-binding protein